MNEQGLKSFIEEENKFRRTIVFDLDETLIHCSKQNGVESQVYLELEIEQKKVRLGINIRPYVQYALEKLSSAFEIIIYTASHSDYANKVNNIKI